MATEGVRVAKLWWLRICRQHRGPKPDSVSIGVPLTLVLHQLTIWSWQTACQMKWFWGVNQCPNETMMTVDQRGQKCRWFKPLNVMSICLHCKSQFKAICCNRPRMLRHLPTSLVCDAQRRNVGTCFGFAVLSNCMDLVVEGWDAQPSRDLAFRSFKGLGSFG